MNNIIIIFSCIFILISVVSINKIDIVDPVIVDSELQGPLMEDGRFYSNIDKDNQIIMRDENS